MFFFTYLRRELRRRMRQAVFIALGLAIGIGLVITVIGASSGVKAAQAEVLRGLNDMQGRLNPSSTVAPPNILKRRDKSRRDRGVALHVPV